MEDRCVCCGGIIPEGRQVCYDCEYIVNEKVKEFSKVWDFLKKACDAIVKTIQEFWNSIKKLFKDWVEVLARIPKNKRDYQTQRLLYYGSIITGKSNNWRRMHGIQMVRRRRL